MTQTQMFEVTIAAVAEIRDADGNLISAEPVTAGIEVTAAQLAELGLTPTEGTD